MGKLIASNDVLTLRTINPTPQASIGNIAQRNDKP